MTEDNELAMMKRLDFLRVGHRKLDREIDAVIQQAPHDQFTLFKLKKEKLSIRDEIMSIENIVYPDIIA